MVVIVRSRLARVRKQVLSGRDIQAISGGVSELPGDWSVDPIIDMRRPGTPRVWLRSDATTAFKPPAIGFERIGRLVWVSMCDSVLPELGMVTGQPFETIAAAFVYLSGRLEAMAAATISSTALA
jgi:hypothetical protein